MRSRRRIQSLSRQCADNRINECRHQEATDRADRTGMTLNMKLWSPCQSWSPLLGVAGSPQVIVENRTGVPLQPRRPQPEPLLQAPRVKGALDARVRSFLPCEGFNRNVPLSPPSTSTYSPPATAVGNFQPPPEAARNLSIRTRAQAPREHCPTRHFVPGMFWSTSWSPHCTNWSLLK